MFPTNTTNTAQYLKLNISVFARVNSDRTPEKMSVNTKSIPMITAVVALVKVAVWAMCHRKYTGTIRSARIIIVMIRDTTKLILSRLYNMMPVSFGLALSSKSYEIEFFSKLQNFCNYWAP
jgi:hypothetical protein